MCPACIAMAALTFTGTVSAGGLAALAARTGRLGRAKGAAKTKEAADQTTRRDDHGKH